MKQPNKEIVAYVAQPAHLPTAYAIASWLDATDSGQSVPSEVRELLSDASNLTATTRIREALAIIEIEAFRLFWRNVEDFLNQMLLRSSGRNWKVKLSMDSDEVKGGYISIVPATEAVDLGDILYVCAEHLAVPKNYERCFFGIWKPQRRKHDPELQPALEREGFKANEHWAGYKYFHACGMPDFTKTQENVVRVSADNHFPDHPLANEVAQTLWQLFDTYRFRLEKLDGMNF